MQMGQSLEAFQQWKTLVSLLFNCIDAVSTDSVLFVIYTFQEWQRNVVLK